MPRFIIDGFVFHVNIMKGKCPVQYLRCLEYKRLGCHARAIMPTNGDIEHIQIKQAHNHPPDYTAEEKIIFVRELRNVVTSDTTVDIKSIYDSLSKMYPTAAIQLPFSGVKFKMLRWRKFAQTTAKTDEN